MYPPFPGPTCVQEREDHHVQRDMSDGTCIALNLVTQWVSTGGAVATSGLHDGFRLSRKPGDMTSNFLLKTRSLGTRSLETRSLAL